MNRRSTFQVMLRLIGLIKPLVGIMCIAIIMGVLGFLAAIFIPTFGGYAILSVVGVFHSISLKTIYISIIVFAFLRGILRYAEQECNHYIAFKLLATIRDQVFTSLRRLGPAKLDGKEKGNMIALITSDIELLEVFYAHTISPICIAILISLFMVCFLANYHIVLGIIALITYLTVGCLIPIIISKKSQSYGNELRHQFGVINSFFLDSLRGIKQSIQYGSGERRLALLNKLTDQLSDYQKNIKTNTGFCTALGGLCIFFFSLATLSAAYILYLSGKLSFEGVFISTIAMFSSFGAVIAVSNLGSGLVQTIASGNRVLDILDDTPVVEENTSGCKIEFESAHFNEVNFAYQDELILKDFNINIQKNNIIGIIGKSGSGKSTMLKLLMRFWDVNTGEVLVSNQNIKDINTTYLRTLESYVTQETVLFHNSIEKNIKIANLNATHKQVVAACKKASIHQFILSLPQGYDTNVGELGGTLSEGEKQRIGLARAFLHNAPLLLLDEPTSNLDSLNEAVILKALREDKNRTTVLVSHRPSTMTIADIVYSVENGRRS